jgi:hypothetical protein
LRSALLALCLAGLAPVLLHAEDQSFTFALPETEGRISLGVYDGSGTLVRTLFTSAEEKDFQIGLNGLITTWNGKDDAGKALPAGKYFVRGWVVPESVQAEGVAFHFNDWITDDATPRISGIGAVFPMDDERLWVFGFRPGKTAAEDALWTYREEEGLKAEAELPSKSRFLAAKGALAAISNLGEGTAWLYSAGDSGQPAKLTGKFTSGAFWKDSLFLSSDTDGGQIAVQPLPMAGLEMGLTSSPAEGVKLDANASALIAWKADKIWLRRNDAFEPAVIEAQPEAFDLSAGPDETFWVAGRSGEDIVVRQQAFGGELLREMKIQEDFAEQIHVFASKTSLSFFLLLQSSHWSRQTVRGYRPATANEPAKDGETVRVDWEVFFDKTIENSRRFGLKDGRLVADAGSVPQPDRQKITLPADSLTGKKGSIVLSAVFRPDGLWLATGDGLPLRKLSEARFERVVVAPGEAANTLRLFAGDGVVVSEYLLSGLDGFAAIDAGEIDLP